MISRAYEYIRSFNKGRKKVRSQVRARLQDFLTVLTYYKLYFKKIK
jgi:hypothetical protein